MTVSKINRHEFPNTGVVLKYLPDFAMKWSIKSG